jgi:hypothetical protein
MLNYFVISKKYCIFEPEMDAEKAKPNKPKRWQNFGAKS